MKNKQNVKLLISETKAPEKGPYNEKYRVQVKTKRTGRAFIAEYQAGESQDDWRPGRRTLCDRLERTLGNYEIVYDSDDD